MCKFSSKSGGVPFQPLGDLTWHDPYVFFQEYEQLCLENEGLQRQLHSQEEEYRLQNQTLMTELATVNNVFF